MKLKKRYNDIVQEYIFVFQKKHDIELDYWVADNIGSVACFGDYFLNFDDIRFDIDNRIEKENILDWYNETIDLALENKQTINYRNWLKTNGKI